MTTRDNNFPVLVTGQGNWDTDLDTMINIAERGYHVTEHAGTAISTGQVLWLNSGGFFFPFDPNSADIYPMAMAFNGANSGDSMQALAWGIVRSLGINSAAVPGGPLYVSMSTPGLIVSSYSGADRQVGWGLANYGVLFNPVKAKAPLDVVMTTSLIAGAAVNTGYAVWVDPNSSNVAKHFDPNSEAIQPTALALTGAAGAGSAFIGLMKGMVRSLGITSAPSIGKGVFVSQSTPGILVNSYSGEYRRVGMVVSTWGIMWDPMGYNFLPERLTSSLAINAVTGSLHIFTMDAGRWGWNRYTKMVGNSANLVELKFYQDSARTLLLFSTISGGVTTVGSFYDRAGWPFENGDATFSGLTYGSLKIMSAAAVGSDTISVQAQWDRDR